MSVNEHTGARLVSKPPTKEYQEGFDRIFGDKKEDIPVWVLGEAATEVKQDCCGNCDCK